MHSSLRPRLFSSSQGAQGQGFPPPCPTTPDNMEISPYFNEDGRLTPASEDINQFLLDSRKSQTDLSLSNLSLVDDSVVAVIGVGYVGSELVQAFSKHYPVIAFDVSKQRIETVRGDFDASSVYLTSDPAEITQATHILIAVPTRVHEEDKTIDTSHLQSAIKTISRYARPGSTIVVESSVAVGMTRDLLGPLQQQRGYKAGMSPERVDPGRTNIEFEAIPKVISGLDDQSLQSIQKLYERVFEHVVPVSSCEVAEMTKLYENCQRMMAIAYVNEMADACQSIGIDPIEVCSAAATKPFGYQPYSPGAGVGGHCIPVNPYYLLSNMKFPLLQACTEKMWQRPAALATSVMDSLTAGKPKWRISSSDSLTYQSTMPGTPTRVLVVGTAFKPGQSVISHSPGIAMIDHLIDSYDNVTVEFCDPLVGAEAIPQATKFNEAADWNVMTLDNHYDAVIVAMPQHGIDLNILTQLQKTQVFNFTTSLKGFGSSKKSGSSKDQSRMAAKRHDSAVAF